MSGVGSCPVRLALTSWPMSAPRLTAMFQSSRARWVDREESGADCGPKYHGRVFSWRSFSGMAHFFDATSQYAPGFTMFMWSR